MKNKILLAVLAIALVFGMTACGDGGGGTSTKKDLPTDPVLETVTYAGYTDYEAYTLTITQSSARYAAQTGDSYIMSIFSFSDYEVKTSTGTVAVAESTFTLSKGGTVTVNSTGGITATTEITLDDGTTQPAADSINVPSAEEAAEYIGTWAQKGFFSINIKEDGTFVSEYLYMKHTLKGAYVINASMGKAVFIPANFKHEGALCYPNEEKDHMEPFTAEIEGSNLTIGIWDAKNQKMGFSLPRQ